MSSLGVLGRPSSPFLPAQNPEAVIVRLVDPVARRFYIATSLQNPSFFHVSDHPLTNQDSQWRSFRYPGNMGKYSYDRVMSAFAEFAQITDLTTCQIGIPPIDPFNPRRPPTSVLWICTSRETSARVGLWVLKVSNGALGTFRWSSMGITKPEDGLLTNSSSAEQVI